MHLLNHSLYLKLINPEMWLFNLLLHFKFCHIYTCRIVESHNMETYILVLQFFMVDQQRCWSTMKNTQGTADVV